MATLDFDKVLSRIRNIGYLVGVVATASGFAVNYLYNEATASFSLVEVYILVGIFWSFILLVLLVVYQILVFRKLRGQLDVVENVQQEFIHQSGLAIGVVDGLGKAIIEHREKLEICTSVVEQNTTVLYRNAQIVKGGFIGLQEKAISIERIQVVPQKSLRFSIHGHLPSHIRMEKMTLERAQHLYDGWEPVWMIGNYLELINERFMAHNEYIESGGECCELYSFEALKKYATGATDFDAITDPVEERKSRFKKLLELNEKDNYKLLIFPKSLGINLILRVVKNVGFGAMPVNSGNLGLLVDMRLPDSVTSFEKSCYGVYCQSPDICYEYLEKVNQILKTNPTIPLVRAGITNQESNAILINNLIATIV